MVNGREETFAALYPSPYNFRDVREFTIEGFDPAKTIIRSVGG